MKKKRQYKVGDKVVEPGNVYRIFKIEKKKNGEGQLQKVIFFKPFFEAKNESKIVCSIPVKNIRKIDLRRVLSKKELQELLGQLKKGIKLESPTDAKELKEILNLNDLTETVRVLKTLWKEKNTFENFSKSKKDVMDAATESFAQELASVKGISLDKAREKIIQALK